MFHLLVETGLPSVAKKSSLLVPKDTKEATDAQPGEVFETAREKAATLTPNCVPAEHWPQRLTGVCSMRGPKGNQLDFNHLSKLLKMNFLSANSF